MCNSQVNYALQFVTYRFSAAITPFSLTHRSFRRHPRRAKDDAVDVHVKVRGKQETRSRPQCIIAQAAPEEKAIVLRDSKESAAPFIRKIKVDDVYGADAVRVENGVVKIKVGDLTTRGRWVRDSSFEHITLIYREGNTIGTYPTVENLNVGN